MSRESVHTSTKSAFSDKAFALMSSTGHTVAVLRGFIENAAKLIYIPLATRHTAAARHFWGMLPLREALGHRPISSPRIIESTPKSRTCMTVRMNICHLPGQLLEENFHIFDFRRGVFRATLRMLFDGDALFLYSFSAAGMSAASKEAASARFYYIWLLSSRAFSSIRISWFLSRATPPAMPTIAAA